MYKLDVNIHVCVCLTVSVLFDLDQTRIIQKHKKNLCLHRSIGHDRSRSKSRTRTSDCVRGRVCGRWARHTACMWWWWATAAAGTVCSGSTAWRHRCRQTFSCPCSICTRRNRRGCTARSGGSGRGAASPHSSAAHSEAGAASWCCPWCAASCASHVFSPRHFASRPPVGQRIPSLCEPAARWTADRESLALLTAYLTGWSSAALFWPHLVVRACLKLDSGFF